LIENKNSFWTFPEFKSNHKVNQNELPKNLRELIFPDPKYYMIGFNPDKKEQETKTRLSDWTISQSKTNDTLKKSFNKPSSPLEASTYSDQSWQNISSKNHKSMIQKGKTNKRHPSKPKKSIQFAGSKRSSINSVLQKTKFSSTSKNQSSVKTSSKVKNYSMIKKYMLKHDSAREEKKFSVLKKKAHKNSTPVSNSVLVQGRSIDASHNLSQISGRSYLDKSNVTQTPRTRAPKKFYSSMDK